MRCLTRSFCFLLLIGAVSLSAHAPFFVYSPPKCGTHLIAKTLGLLLDETPVYRLRWLGTTQECLDLVESLEDQFLVAHNYTPEMLQQLVERGRKVVFILRDPRDQLVSAQRYIHEGNWQQRKAAHLKDEQLQLEEMITGHRWGWRCYENFIGQRLNRLRQLPPPKTLIVRFEDLVGPEGGGSRKAQEEALQTLCAFLETELKLGVADQIFGGTKTFRDGRIGRWREFFTPRMCELYKKRYGKTLIELGYEKDLNW